MAKSKRVYIGLHCTECNTQNYVTTRGKADEKGKLKPTKHCTKCRKHSEHKAKDVK